MVVPFGSKGRAWLRHLLTSAYTYSRVIADNINL